MRLIIDYFYSFRCQ
ncbi:Hypothetical protein EIN_313150, partial [Entamoeba invadens IP1]